MMRLALAGSVLAFASLFAAQARAEITVSRAEYAAGILVIEGNTPYANQFVSLDGRYRERTRGYGKFLFRIRYLPKNCEALLKAGSQTKKVRIENCDAVQAGAQTKSVKER